MLCRRPTRTTSARWDGDADFPHALVREHDGDSVRFQKRGRINAGELAQLRLFRESRKRASGTQQYFTSEIQARALDSASENVSLDGSKPINT
jgi:hypothetical protein